MNIPQEVTDYLAERDAEAQPNLVFAEDLDGYRWTCKNGSDGWTCERGNKLNFDEADDLTDDQIAVRNEDSGMLEDVLSRALRAKEGKWKDVGPGGPPDFKDTRCNEPNHGGFPYIPPVYGASDIQDLKITHETGMDAQRMVGRPMRVAPIQGTIDITFDPALWDTLKDQEKFYIDVPGSGRVLVVPTHIHSDQHSVRVEGIVLDE